MSLLAFDTSLTTSCSNCSSAYAPTVILIIAISELWKSHWRFVVDQIPFHPSNVVSATSAALKKRFAEDHLSDFQ
jgi:hypothetical protein